ncbi:MAG: hypothetical protein R6W78_13180 [Bacteroidales bacterium]
MNTHLQVFKNKSHSRLFLMLCLGFMLIGTIGLFMSFMLKMSFIPLLDEACYFVLLFNGLISFWIVWDSMKKSKYFVAWNNREISYLLPKSEKTEVIIIENIKSIDIFRSEIIIGLNNSETKHFNLNYFFFPERKTIIDFFEELKK